MLGRVAGKWQWRYPLTILLLLLGIGVCARAVSAVLANSTSLPTSLPKYVSAATRLKPNDVPTTSKPMAKRSVATSSTQALSPRIPPQIPTQPPPITPPTETPTQTPVPACGLNWRIAASPSVTDSTYFNSVASISETDAWAVGVYLNSTGIYRTMTQHWDGLNWSIIPSPNINGHGYLNSVAALSANDIWAVGDDQDPVSPQPIAAHWDGIAWSLVPIPSFGAASTLRAVAAIGSDDLWAVGYYQNAGEPKQTLTVHWDGTQWGLVSSPNLGTGNNALESVSANSPTNVWAVGSEVNGGPLQPLALRWDGTQWISTYGPIPMSYEYMKGVTVSSSGNIWAVGVEYFGTFWLPRVWRWNGTGWLMNCCSGPISLGFLNSVVAPSANDVWVSGYTSYNPGRTLVVHWNGSQWSQVISRDIGESYNEIKSLAALSPDNIWAVGFYNDSGGAARTLAERYSDPCVTPSPTMTGTTPTFTPNATHTRVPSFTPTQTFTRTQTPTPTLSPTITNTFTQSRTRTTTSTRTRTPTRTATPECWPGFSIVSSPNSGPGANYLNAVGVISSNNVWAVGGYYDIGGSTSEVLTEQWNGSQWTIVPGPRPTESTGASLAAIGVVSANDIWAAGSYDITPGDTHALIEHWNGTQWSIVLSPEAPGASTSFLSGMAAISVNDVWAVGAYYSTSSSQYKTLTMHWDGTLWSVISSRNPSGTGSSYLSKIAAVSSNDVWAVGYVARPQGIADEALIEHWNGTLWSIVPTPYDPNRDDYLYGVAAISANDVWAVGYYSYSTPKFTLIEHWNGTSWSIVSSPNPAGASQNYLQSVAAISANDVWAVGHSVTTSNGLNVSHALLAHWNGTSWSAVANPSPPRYDDNPREVAVVSANNVWTVGWDRSQGTYMTFTEHWDGTQWSVVPSPNTGTGAGSLSGIEALASNDIWSVGSKPNGTLVEHWNGLNWSVVDSPNREVANNHLSAVSASSASDIWAVGKYWEGATDIVGTLVEHWDGTQWSIVPSPNVTGTSNNYLLGVATISTNDAWAVGSYYSTTNTTQTLIEHWNGTQWSIVASPNPISSSITLLESITALSANDVWAVGYAYIGGHDATLVEHWDGSQWSIVPSPNGPSTGHNELYGVTAVTANDIWAVGSYQGTSGPFATLIEHWNGSQWSIVPSPNPVSADSAGLFDVAAVSAGDVWAVGTYFDFSRSNWQTLSMHWDGSQWAIIFSDNQGDSGSNRFWGVVMVSTHDVWAAGTGSSGTLVERYTGPCPEITSTPTMTRTPTITVTSSSSTPTSTPTITGTRIPSNTPTTTYTPTPTNAAGIPTNTTTPIRTSTYTPTPAATQTPCPINFTDVHTTDYFYVPVQFLFCHNVISGYGTEFRPYNNTSRGQLSKIVVLGFSLPINTTGGPHFVDVPTFNVFYPYVETAYNRGIVNGYGTEFRPNDNVTRSQLSKIVVLTAAWALRTPSTATFTDVPVGSTFFSYVETAYCHGIVTGYGSLFKPNDPATRGQISKIVYLAVQNQAICSSLSISKLR